ncbi:MAG: hypothetical protein ACO3RU_01585 [Planctomycetota bacterium]
MTDPVPGLDWEAVLEGAPSGFDVTPADRAALDASAGAGAATYGEVLPHAARRLLRWLALGPDDVFADLGSGSGRLVFQAACETRVRKAVGVELSVDRHRAAEEGLRRLVAACPAEAGAGLASRIQLLCEDVRATDVRALTVVYVAATSFPAPLWSDTCRRLAEEAPGLRRLVATRPLPAPWDRHFPLVGELELDMTWTRNARVHVHRTPARR